MPRLLGVMLFVSQLQSFEFHGVELFGEVAMEKHIPGHSVDRLGVAQELPNILTGAVSFGARLVAGRYRREIARAVIFLVAGWWEWLVTDNAGDALLLVWLLLS